MSNLNAGRTAMFGAIIFMIVDLIAIGISMFGFMMSTFGVAGME